jgi:hypothetical protein
MRLAGQAREVMPTTFGRDAGPCYNFSFVPRPWGLSDAAPRSAARLPALGRLSRVGCLRGLERGVASWQSAARFVEKGQSSVGP